MMRLYAGALAVALALLLMPAVSAAPAPAPEQGSPVHKPAPKAKATHGKRRIDRHWHGYGFLPGYRPPEVIEREREARYWRSGPHFYGPAWPRYYHGRWNGGGFGPCWTQTPIGYMWNCGQ